MLRSALHIFLFLGGLLGTATVIHLADPLPFWSWMRSKFAYANEHIGEYDTLFLGSSRIHRGIVPAEFDRRMAELGAPTKSFNLGFAGRRPHDFTTMLRWVCGLQQQRIRRCIVEVHSFEQGARTGNWLADDDVEMHDPRGFGRRVAAALNYPGELSRRLDVLHFTAMHTLANGLRVGQGPRLVGDWLSGVTSQPIADAGFADVAFELRQPERKAQHAAWRSNPQNAVGALEYKRKNPMPERLLGGFDVASLREQAQMLKAAGIQPIFVVMPVWSHGLQGRDALDELGEELDVLVLDRPDLLPELFVFDEWFDSDHLTLGGAKRFSAYLAEALHKR